MTEQTPKLLCRECGCTRPTTCDAEVAALREKNERLEAELNIQHIKLDRDNRCLDCCSELAMCGPPGIGGEPSWVCLLCEMRERVEKAKARVKELEAHARCSPAHGCALGGRWGDCPAMQPAQR